MCRSLTFAQRAARLLERANISSHISKAPQGVTPEGCSYGVKISSRRFEQAVKILKEAKLPTGRVYRIDESGNASEVKR